jgi:hypothetical protein
VKQADSLPISQRDKLEEKYKSYLELTKEVRDEHGFIDNCDSLLFTSLSNIGGFRVDLDPAQDDERPGVWYRTPSHDCYPRRSGSTISKDMLLGLIWESIYYGGLGRLGDLYDYGSQNSWIMGEGAAGRVVLSPSLVRLLTRAIHHLDGPEYKEEMSYPIVYPDLRGYEAHLQTIYILATNDVDGEIDEQAANRIHGNYARSSRNALFAYAYHLFTDGDQSETIDILLEFPDRLPTSGDWCEHYLWEREPEKWKPCPEDRKKEVYPGVDFILVAGLVLNGG